MRSDNPWKIQTSKVVYQNPWIKIHEDQVIMPSGRPGLYAYLESKNSVVIVVLNDKQQLYLMRAFNYPVATWSWRIPQGGGDKEDPLTASMRELQEETGITAKQWTKLGEFRVCNGLMTESSVVYLASDISLQQKIVDDNEPMDGVKWAPIAEADRMIEHGEIDDGQSIVAIHLVQKWLAKKGRP